MGSTLKKRFPYIYTKCLEHGVDITKEPAPIAPAAHYLCGGVYTDLQGRSTIAHLNAIGEAACGFTWRKSSCEHLTFGMLDWGGNDGCSGLG